MYRNKQALSYPEVLSKLMKYCSYQERSLLEVSQKLKSFNVNETDRQKVIDYLIDENFINEERFATLYVRGKVNVKKWGIYKIREGLALKGVKSDLATKVLAEIDRLIYKNNLEELTDKKYDALPADEKRKEKLYRYLQAKGYEGDLIMQQLKRKHLM